MKTYFEEPKQVLFADEEGTWQCGIAYEDYVICACCGGIFYIEDIIENAPSYVQYPIHEYETWVSLTDEIYGGEYPKTFIVEVARADRNEL
jgi:hypothetical protein